MKIAHAPKPKQGWAGRASSKKFPSQKYGLVEAVLLGQK